MGDEAIVDTERSASKDARSERSGSRSRGCGRRVTGRQSGSSARSTTGRQRLEQIANDWRRGAPERGFSMAMDSLRNPHGEKTLVVYAADDDDEIRGFLHFVPTYGRDAVSLSFMRREHDTPNGLTEFLIVEAIEHLRARGVAEVSLNFAAFARLIREPRGFVERTSGPGSRSGRHVVSDRASLSLQCQVLPALGAALLHV